MGINKTEKRTDFSDGSFKLLGFLDQFKSISEVSLSCEVNTIRESEMLGDGYHPN